MLFDLSPAEIRVLCTLMEKAETTPDQYPLSSAALTTACNQKTSRDPVTEYTENEVDAVLLSLRERQVARSLKPSGSRGWKHRHCLDEVLPMTMPEQAVITVLGLRGAQSAGELKTRTNRIHEFGTNEEVEATLAELAARPTPVVSNVGRDSGQSQDRWVHLLNSDAQSPAQGRQRVMAAEFATLHESGFFAMPNAWDFLSAVEMQKLGAKAIATSSVALAETLGKNDYEVSREDVVAHIEMLTSHIDIPLNVDGEQLFPNEPGGIAKTVEMFAAAGAAGVSIEDFDPATETVVSREAALSAVEEAVSACRANHVVLTARCEHYLYGNEDLDEVTRRLASFAAAGADCVYAPGVTDEVELLHLVEEAGAPLNVLAMPAAPNADALAELGVRRASTGSAVFRKTQAAMVEHTRNFLGTTTT